MAGKIFSINLVCLFGFLLLIFFGCDEDHKQNDEARGTNKSLLNQTLAKYDILIEAYNFDECHILIKKLEKSAVIPVSQRRAIKDLLQARMLLVKSDRKGIDSILKRVDIESLIESNPGLGVRFLLLKSEVAFNWGSKLDAWNNLQRALRIARKHEAFFILGKVYLQMGTIQYFFKSSKEAHKYFNKAKSYAKETGDLITYTEVMRKLAYVSGADSMLFYYGKSLQLATKNHYIHQQVSTLFMIGKRYAHIENHDSAEYYFEKFFTVINENKLQYYDHLTMVKYIKAERVLLKGNYKQALQYYEEALVLATSNKRIEQELAILLQLIYIAEKHNDLERQSFYQSEYINRQLRRLAYEYRMEVEQKNAITQLYELEIKRNNELKNREIRERKSKYQRSIIFLMIPIIVLLFLALFYYRRSLQQKSQILQFNEQRNILLTRVNKDLTNRNQLLRLETLFNQLNPHFIFNSFNVLNSLIHYSNKQAKRFLLSFATLMRQITENKSIDLVTVEKEMEVVDHYINLLKIRLPGKIQFEQFIPAMAGRLQVPPFSIQLLIENVIKHNEPLGNGAYYISVYYYNGCITVRNRMAKKAATGEVGTGLKNLKQRCRLLNIDDPVVFENNGYFFVRLYTQKTGDL
jgi:sensor histidine kinase YesM